MRMFLRPLLFAVLTAGFSHAESSLQELAWLAGIWTREGKTSTITEEWTPVDAKLWRGAGIAIGADGQKSRLETLLLTEIQGDVFYFAKVPQNHLPIAFKLVRLTATEAEFSNPQHDFPQTIRYHLTAPAKLTVHVSSSDNEGFTVEYTRSP